MQGLGNIIVVILSFRVCYKSREVFIILLLVIFIFYVSGLWFYLVIDKRNFLKNY